MDVCVVGAGIIGAATAFELTSRGARVTVVDASTEPRGATFASLGWTNANNKQPDHYFALNRDGMAAHQELRDALGGGEWLNGGGSLEWVDAAGIAKLRARVEDHAAQGYAAEMIRIERARELEPSLAFDGAVTELAYFAAEGWVDGLLLAARLLSAARDDGATVRTGIAVESASPDGALLADGTHLSADVIVNCTGPDAGRLAADGGLSIDTVGAIGLSAVTEAGEFGVGRVVRAPGVHIRPQTGGRLMIAAASADTELAAGADPAELARRLLGMATQYVPALAGVGVAEARVARRAIPPDGLPIVGRLPDSPWLYHVVTHSGVTLSPLLGRLVAQELVDGTHETRLAPYRPDRFASR